MGLNNQVPQWALSIQNNNYKEDKLPNPLLNSKIIKYINIKCSVNELEDIILFCNVDSIIDDFKTEN